MTKMFPENVKRYFVKYTIYDGEHEYADNVTHELDPERINDDAYVLNTIMGKVDPDEVLTPYDDRGHYEDPCGDYRLYELYSVKEIPAKDFKILNKYGV